MKNLRNIISIKNPLFILVIIVSIFIISCKKEIVIKIPEKKPSLVIYSTLVPYTLPQPKSLNIKIESSLSFYDTTKVSVIKDALVLFYKNGNFIDTIRYIDSLKNYPIPLNFYPNVGDNVRMKVIKDGYKSVSAATTISSKVEIKNISVIPFAYFNDIGEVFSEIDITFDDHANELNYYEVAVSELSTEIAFNYDNPENYYSLSSNDNIITSESYYPSPLNFDLKPPLSLLFNDKEINGTEHILKIYYMPVWIGGAVRCLSDNYINIHLRNVTEEYYKFKTTMIEQLNNQKENILYGMGEPLNVYTNIENGYGVFAGFNNDIKTYHQEQINY